MTQRMFNKRIRHRNLASINISIINWLLSYKPLLNSSCIQGLTRVFQVALRRNVSIAIANYTV